MSTRPRRCVVPVFASRRHRHRTAAARAAVLVCALGWLGASQASTVDFRLLPAIKSDLAIKSLLLDIAQDDNRL
ncbi:MAG: hypothetical protein WBN44_12235, partial [Woeseiaceae bacterium]